MQNHNLHADDYILIGKVIEAQQGHLKNLIWTFKPQVLPWSCLKITRSEYNRQLPAVKVYTCKGRIRDTQFICSFACCVPHAYKKYLELDWV